LRLESRFFFFLVELLKILIEVDHLQDVPSPYIQIKGANKEAVTAAGSALKLDGSYTTKSYLQIVLERLPPVQRSSSGIHTQQAARLQELVEFIQSQVIKSLLNPLYLILGLLSLKWFFYAFLTTLREVVTVCRNHHQEEMVLP
jgi:hypothetical protein